MFYLLVGVAILMFVILMALVYRIFTLAEIAKETSKDGAKRVGSANALNASLFMIMFFAMFGLIFWYSMEAKQYFLPEAASEHGSSIDFLFWLTTGITFFVFFATHCLLFFFPYIYRFQENRKAFFYPHNNKLELIWTVIPAIALTILVLSGWKVWSEVMQEAPKEALNIEIMGKQFNWQLRYGGKDKTIGKHNFRKIDATNSMGLDFAADPANLDDFMPQEMRMPVGRPVLLKIRARDVLHSVFLPHFRVKMDAVPGMPTQFWFTPTITTAKMREITGNPDFNYELACTEICGSGHFAMKLKVVVVEQDEFDKWYNEQEPWAVANKDYLESIGIKNLAQANAN
jgi:cytochrome c oxidase subunit 2